MDKQITEIENVSEGYQAKKKRWLELAARLPVGLKGRIALRNVEAVSLLEPEAQQTLASALDAGLERISTAIRILRQKPDASVDDILQEVCLPTTTTQLRLDSLTRRSEQPGTALPLASGSSSHVISSLTRTVELRLEGLARLAAQATTPAALPATGGIRAVSPGDPENLQPVLSLPGCGGQDSLPGAAALTGLIQACFPSMPRISAEALAAAGLTASLRDLLHAWQGCLFSPQLTDLTFVILAGFVQQAQAELQEKVSEKPAYANALHNSGVSLPNPERRN